MTPIFVTGIGAGVGKTIIAAIITEALHADYWKPIQAGYVDGTDSNRVKEMLTNGRSIIHPETYLLHFPAPPHISAEDEDVEISLQKIIEEQPETSNQLVIEGTGGLLTPINKNEFIIDLIEKLNANVIIVSRNYPGSINHSLLTAEVLKQRKINVLGWIFNDEYLDYENEIVQWSGFPWIGSIRNLPVVDKSVIHVQSVKLREHLLKFL